MCQFWMFMTFISGLVIGGWIVGKIWQVEYEPKEAGADG